MAGWASSSPEDDAALQLGADAPVEDQLAASFGQLAVTPDDLDLPTPADPDPEGPLLEGHGWQRRVSQHQRRGSVYYRHNDGRAQVDTPDAFR